MSPPSSRPFRLCLEGLFFGEYQKGKGEK